MPVFKTEAKRCRGLLILMVQISKKNISIFNIFYRTKLYQVNLALDALGSCLFGKV